MPQAQVLFARLSGSLRSPVASLLPQKEFFVSDLYREVQACRISGSEDLLPILDLGKQALTGVFPRDVEQIVPMAPLELSWSPSSGLVQLRHSVSPQEMYGENYGYRSGLNPTMVNHLNRKVRWIEALASLNESDVVVDIGSNDGTLLNSYSSVGLRRIGFDPVATKYQSFYDEDITIVPDFFSGERLSEITDRKARVITSVAMFYDLEDPGQFVREIAESLDSDGIWHFEQSYLPAMLRTNSYDTICHEHVEYYSLSVVVDLLAKNKMRVVDVQTNSINGGSFAVTATHESASIESNQPVIDWLLQQEENFGLGTPKPYESFKQRVFQHREDLRALVNGLNRAGKKVAAYGASTKGNVLLQFCGFGPEDILCIAEVNPEKFGAFTPGSRIPILPESEVRAMKPDYLLVLPWHFKQFIIEKEASYLENGGQLIFPLPEIEIVC